MFLKFSVFLFFISQFVNSEITSNDYLNHYLENKGNTKLLKVDFVVIQNLNIDKTDLKEKWEDLDAFNFSEELIALKEEPTKLVSLPSKYINDKSVFHFIEAGKKENTEKVVESKTQRIKPFLYERIPFEKEMQKIEKNLNRSRDYRVLYYNSWFQPAFNKNKTIPIAINQIKKSNKVIRVPNLKDHRICMSAVILSLITGIKANIKNFETVNTSAPSFLRTVKSIGGNFEIKKK